jgi:hypothetical protein
MRPRGNNFCFRMPAGLILSGTGSFLRADKLVYALGIMDDSLPILFLSLILCLGKIPSRQCQKILLTSTEKFLIQDEGLKNTEFFF